ncbi:ABC transporter permease [Pseudarthrobacter sp. H2]|uniref:ABC transporter permease n=1 Tax=Pseudarthrobacter sp. H2 TaxID=3418415 RepID=UPI003CE6DD94
MSLWTYLVENQSDLTTQVVQHVMLVLGSMAIATVIAVGIGLASYRSNLTERIAVSTTGALFTIPSLAMFGLLIPILGLGAGPAMVALVVYATLPILRNTYAGLQSVDSAVLDAARGIGMSPLAVLLKVRLPLAGPVILVGMRVATQMGIGIATIAAYAGGPGLGNEIFSGLARFGATNSLTAVTVGLIGVVILALIADAVFVVVDRFLIPRSIHV